MKIIIYDTEFTAWKGSAQRNWQGPNEYKELIQVSAIKLKLSSLNIEVLDEIHHFVKPTRNTELSEYIKSLTLISQDDVDSGLHPTEFYQQLKKFSDSGSIPLYSWGNDYHVLQETAKINNTELSWVKSHDLRPIFHEHGVPQSTTSGTLYLHFNLELDIHEHNAKDDTLSLTESLKYLFSKNPKQVANFFLSLT